jgi:hypothetical protein
MTENTPPIEENEQTPAIPKQLDAATLAAIDLAKKQLAMLEAAVADPSNEAAVKTAHAIAGAIYRTQEQVAPTYKGLTLVFGAELDTEAMAEVEAELRALKEDCGPLAEMTWAFDRIARRIPGLDPVVARVGEVGGERARHYSMDEVVTVTVLKPLRRTDPGRTTEVTPVGTVVRGTRAACAKELGIGWNDKKAGTWKPLGGGGGGLNGRLLEHGYVSIVTA